MMTSTGGPQGHDEPPHYRQGNEVIVAIFEHRHAASQADLLIEEPGFMPGTLACQAPTARRC